MFDRPLAFACAFWHVSTPLTATLLNSIAGNCRLAMPITAAAPRMTTSLRRRAADGAANPGRDLPRRRRRTKRRIWRRSAWHDAPETCSRQKREHSRALVSWHLKRLYDDSWNGRFGAASKLWQTFNAEACNGPCTRHCFAVRRHSIARVLAAIQADDIKKLRVRYRPLGRPCWMRRRVHADRGRPQGPPLQGTT